MATLNHQLSFKVDQDTFERLEESATELGESVGSHSRRLIQAVLTGDMFNVSRSDKESGPIENVDREMLRCLAQRVEDIEGKLTCLAHRQYDAQQQMEERIFQHVDQHSSLIMEALGRVLTSTFGVDRGIDAIHSTVSVIREQSGSLAEVAQQELVDAITNSLSPTEILAAIEVMREDWIKAFGIIMLKRLGCSREDAVGWMQARLEKNPEGSRALHP